MGEVGQSRLAAPLSGLEGEELNELACADAREPGCSPDEHLSEGVVARCALEEEARLSQTRVPVEGYERFGQFAGEADLLQGRDLLLVR